MADNLLPKIQGKTLTISEMPISMEELRDCFDDTHSFDPCKGQHDWDDANDAVRICLRCNLVEDRHK